MICRGCGAPDDQVCRRDCPDVGRTYPGEAQGLLSGQLYDALVGLGNENCWCPFWEDGPHNADCLAAMAAVTAYRLQK